MVVDGGDTVAVGHLKDQDRVSFISGKLKAQRKSVKALSHWSQGRMAAVQGFNFQAPQVAALHMRPGLACVTLTSNRAIQLEYGILRYRTLRGYRDGKGGRFSGTVNENSYAETTPSKCH
jgi:hypothetical protein